MSGTKSNKENQSYIRTKMRSKESNSIMQTYL